MNGEPPDDAPRDVSAPAGPEAATAKPLVVVAWIGLLAGLVELVIVAGRALADPRVSTVAVRTNRHWAWMIPVADTLLFAAVGLVLILVGYARPRLARWATPRLSASLLALAALLRFEELHPVGALALAGGIGAVAGRCLDRRAGSLDRLAWRTLPWLAAGLLAWSGLNAARVVTAERRALAALPPPRAGRPNVLLIVLDTVRAASLSLHGHDRETTPNLERLARRGLVFTEARSTAPWTLPSHASLFTGRWPFELSVGPDRPLDGTHPTLAEVLGREGYAAAGFAANTRYTSAWFGLDRGFARYEDAYENQTVSLFETIRCSSLGRRVVQALGYPVHPDAEGTALRKTAAMINRDALGWLASRPEGRPFFLFLNYYDAHSPYVPPDDEGPRFGRAALPMDRQVEIDARFRDQLAGRPGPAGVPPEWIQSDAIELYRDAYESCIASLDRQLGLLFDALERRGELDQTLVVVTSDHGEHLGEHHILGHGNSLYRPEVHVPLVVVPPGGLDRTRLVDRPVSIRDVPATIADVVGLSPHGPFPGRPLTRFLDETMAHAHDPTPVLTEVQHITVFAPVPHVPSSLGPVRSVVSPRATYIRRHDGREELYDLAHDPHEANDLAQHPDALAVLESLRENLDRLGARTGPSTRE